jgi:amino acid/amide ABC transporter ATP-binding protein 2, HAAT family (TC 3.A.1.4.-)
MMDDRPRTADDRRQTMDDVVLLVQDLHVSYGVIRALKGISFEVRRGEIVTLIGANGAGKSTTLRAISRLVPIQQGSILFEGVDLRAIPPHEVTAMGISHVPEGRGIFANLTVQENLKLATWGRKDPKEIQQAYERVFSLFPRLAERRNQLAGTLSGGEQQMLAVGRALMRGGRLMLLDEPSMGLAPVLVREIFDLHACRSTLEDPHPAGGAERPPGAETCPPGLRSGDRHHRPGGHVPGTDG